MARAPQTYYFIIGSDGKQIAYVHITKAAAKRRARIAGRGTHVVGIPADRVLAFAAALRRQA